jgi:hypothetical protein
MGLGKGVVVGVGASVAGCGWLCGVCGRERERETERETDRERERKRERERARSCRCTLDKEAHAILRYTYWTVRYSLTINLCNP